MKLGKIILPALLAIGAVSGFAFAKVAEERQQLAPAAAMYGRGDEAADLDIDVGINVQKTKNGSWAIGQFYLNTFESGDVSGGDYLAFRMRSNNGGASYFDFIPNVGGNANRVPISPAATGIKCVPAVPGGVAFDYGGARTWDLPMNFWDGADVWFCIPKTTFSRNYFGTGTINWATDGLWAVYFMFYGEPDGDNVNFDIGNIYTANIDGDGHLVKVKRILNWASIASGTATNDTGDGSLAKLNVTRNNANLVPAVKLIQDIENIDACNATACSETYADLSATYEGFTAAQLMYLDEVVLYDYQDGDTAHNNGVIAQWSAAAKWAQIAKLAGHPVSANINLFTKKEQNTILIISVATAFAVLSVAGLFFIIRRRKLEK